MPRAKPFLLLTLAVLLAHGYSLGGSFQFDDFNIIVDNPRVHSLDAWAHGLGGIRPLLKLSYALNWIADPTPLGFHLVNLAIHAANACLAFALLQRFDQGDSRDEGVAFAAALLWALHPVQTEAVVYICGRSSSLMATFALASLLAHDRGRRACRADTRAVRAWRLASLLAFLLAALSKETALALPAVVLLWEICAPPARGWKEALAATAPQGAMALFLGLGFLLLPGPRELLVASLAARGIAVNLLNQVQAAAYLLGAWAWPRTLNIDPALAQLTQPDARTAALVAGFAGLGLIVFVERRRRSWLAFGLLWCAFWLAPTNSLLPRYDIVNERQLYLASLGLAFIASKALLETLNPTGATHPSRAYLVTVGCLAMLLGSRTFLRNRDYRSETALWTASIAANASNPRAHNNLGWARALEGDVEGARACYRRALALDPAYAKARANLDALEGGH